MCPHNPVYPAGLFSKAFLHREHRSSFQAGQPDYSKSLISVIKALMDCSQDIKHAAPLLNSLLDECAELLHGRGLPGEAQALLSGRPWAPLLPTPRPFLMPRKSLCQVHSQTELLPTPTPQGFTKVNQNLSQHFYRC